MSSQAISSPINLPQDPEQLIDEKQAAAFLGYTRRALQNWRRTGTGPRFVKVSSRSIRYRRRDLIAWGEARNRNSTSDEGPTAGVAS
ncbi:MAG: helix-turn-helix domain-containing protein [bacterium]